MPWIQLRFDVLLAQVEELENELLEMGASAVTLLDGADQPVLEPIRGTTPLWDHTQVMGLFEADSDVSALLAHITAVYTEKSQPIPQAKAEILEDKDWEREWMQNFHPIACGEQLWITPSWREPPKPDAVNLLLDPGLAFGTGTHPTTFMCLQWLDAHIAEVKQALVVDYGCGSGILGIAALLLGARYFVGVDNDPQAITASRDNAQRNAINEQDYQVYLPQHYPAQQADIVLANILAGPLIELQAQIIASIKPGGLLVLSGILDNQYQQVMDAYQHAIKFDPIQTQEQWVRLSGRKIA